MRGFEYVGGGSEKFWEVGQSGAAVTVRFGRLGTAGQTQTKDLGDATKAAAHVEKLIAEKVKKGYREVAAAGAPAPTPAPAQEPSQEQPDAQPDVQPDEDTFVLPAAWVRKAEPFRGLRPAVPPRVDAEETRARAQELRRDLEPQLADVFAHPSSDPELVRHAEQHRAGRPDPVGAAVLITALFGGRRSQPDWVRSCQVLVDDLVLTHGVAFAAEAGMHFADLARGFDRYVSGTVQRSWVQRTVPGRHVPYNVAAVLVPLRAHLAAAPDDVYADAVARLGAARGGSLNVRLAAGYLLPTEQSWVHADIAALGAVAAAVQVSSMVVASATDPADVDDLLSKVQLWYVLHRPESVWSLAANLGTAAVGPLTTILDGISDTAWTKRLLGAIATVPTDEAFTALLDRLERKHVQPVVLEAMARFPVRATRLLAPRAGGTGATARTCTELLRGHLISHPEIAERAEEFGAAAVRVASAPTHPVAEPGDLPAVLVDPPWENRGRATARAVLTGLEPPAGPALRWAPGEREEWAAQRTLHSYLGVPTDWVAAVHEAVHRRGRYHWYQLQLLAEAPDELVREHLDDLRPDNVWNGLAALQRILARFDEEAAGFTLRMVRLQPSTLAPALLPAEGPEVAAQMADWLARAKTVRPVARDWFARHPGAAARDLVPVALGKPGRARTAAETALRLLAGTGHRDTVRAAAAGYGEVVVAGVDAVLDADPLDRLPARIPTRPSWLDPAHLPPVLVADRTAMLPTTAVGHLCTMLMLCTPGDTYPGVDVVKAVADPASLAELAWGLLERWQAGGFPSRDGWVLEALALLGDDETVRRLSPLVRTWPGEGGHARAVAGLDVLAAIGTDVALMHLHGISEKVKFKGLRERAKERIAEVAEGLGLSTEQLGDRLVPDFGLDRDGSMVLDYGPRRFTVGFDEQLRPVVVDQDGARRKVLPKPAAKDDPDLAPAAYAAFSGLKKDVRTAAADQIRRFERAMVTGRRWTAAEQRALFVEHPLLWHLARRLVWAVFDADGAVTGAFRLAEDRTPADVEDTELTLDDTATVGIAHPLHLGEQLGAWSEVFADYEILQPFPQLGRDTWALTPQEREATTLQRLDGVKIPIGRVLGLSHRGWERGAVLDGGVSGDVTRATPAGPVLVIDLDPGIIAGMANEWDEQQVTRVWVSADSPGWTVRDNRLPLSVLDDVSASELLRDLEHLRG